MSRPDEGGDGCGVLSVGGIATLARRPVLEGRGPLQRMWYNKRTIDNRGGRGKLKFRMLES